MFRAISRSIGSSSQVYKRYAVPFQSISSIQLRSIFQLKTIENIRKEVSNSTTEQEKIEAVKKYVATKPEEALITLHTGINEGLFVGNNEYARLYLLSLARSKTLEKANMDIVLHMTRKAQGELPSEIQTTEVTKTSTGPLVLNAGNSPVQPIYIQPINNRISGKLKIVEILIKFIIVMIVLTVVFELLVDMTSGATGKNKSSVHQAENCDKRFDDVIGIDEAKQDLQEIVMYLKDPKKFTRLGGNLPKGVLLTGPPGTGKTLLARAIAGEADVPFYFASGSEFEEMFVGVGAKRIRELFTVAKENTPCIIFIDEIDAIGGHRNNKDHSTLRMTLNQLLVEMDGFEQNNGVILIAATNFPESLDPALIRPGRFDKRVDIPTPDIGGRKAILQHYVNKVVVGSDVDLEQLARGTPGFSGADLSNLVNQAAIHAAVQGLKSVSMSAFEYAKDKILMGAERRSAVISPETMKATAFHEAGHAIMALFTKGASPIHKATIMPRGRALGMVMQLPEGDQTSLLYKEMLARLDVCMGGRVAEEIFFGNDNISSGASSDIEQATRMARAMVARFGLSNKVGPILVDSNSSEKTKNEVDDEVRRLLMESYVRTKALIQKHRNDLEIVANGLLEYESLSGSELVDLLKGIKPTNATRSQKPSRDMETIESMKKKDTASVVVQSNKNNTNIAKTTEFNDSKNIVTITDESTNTPVNKRGNYTNANANIDNNSIPSENKDSTEKNKSDEQSKSPQQPGAGGRARGPPK